MKNYQLRLFILNNRQNPTQVEFISAQEISLGKKNNYCQVCNLPIMPRVVFLTEVKTK